MKLTQKWRSLKMKEANEDTLNGGIKKIPFFFFSTMTWFNYNHLKVHSFSPIFQARCSRKDGGFLKKTTVMKFNLFGKCWHEQAVGLICQRMNQVSEKKVVWFYRKSFQQAKKTIQHVSGCQNPFSLWTEKRTFWRICAFFPRFS